MVASHFLSRIDAMMDRGARGAARHDRVVFVHVLRPGAQQGQSGAFDQLAPAASVTARATPVQPTLVLWRIPLPRKDREQGKRQFRTVAARAVNR
jgi:hypothetical protein